MPQSFWEGGPNQSQIEQDMLHAQHRKDLREGRVSPTKKDDRETRDGDSRARRCWGSGRS